MAKYLVSACVCVLLSGVMLPVQARSYQESELRSRLAKLEREVEYMQRGNVGGAAPSGVGAANATARLGEMEQELRNLRGMIEQNDFQIRKLKSEMEAMAKDMEFRLNAMEKSGATAGDSAFEDEDNQWQDPSAPTEPPQGMTPMPKKEEKVEAKPPSLDIKIHTTPPAQAQEAENEVRIIPKFDSPKDHYNYAFSLMNRAQYAKAGDAFQSFLDTYPNDPLISNVYYWLGETYYVQENYVKAADAFSKGFETRPDGGKAPDNLLKLGMALNLNGKKDQACVVLGQLLSKFKGRADSVLAKATREREALGCAR